MSNKSRILKIGLLGIIVILYGIASVNYFSCGEGKGYILSVLTPIILGSLLLVGLLYLTLQKTQSSNFITNVGGIGTVILSYVLSGRMLDTLHIDILTLILPIIIALGVIFLFVRTTSQPRIQPSKIQALFLSIMTASIVGVGMWWVIFMVGFAHCYQF